MLLGSPVNSPFAGEEGPSGIKTTMCPVCEEVIHGSGDELNSHVEACLRKVNSTDKMFILMQKNFIVLGMQHGRCAKPLFVIDYSCNRGN